MKPGRRCRAPLSWVKLGKPERAGWQWIKRVPRRSRGRTVQQSQMCKMKYNSVDAHDVQFTNVCLRVAMSWACRLGAQVLDGQNPAHLHTVRQPPALRDSATQLVVIKTQIL